MTKLIIDAFDTETTGLLKAQDAPLDQQPYITELYAYKFSLDTETGEFKPLAQFDHLIKPPVPLSAKITDITGITNEMLADKPEFCEVFEEYAEFTTGTDMLVAHNLTFDKGMIGNEMKRIGKEFCFPWPRMNVCTVEHSMYIEQRRMTLTNLHKLATGNHIQNAHRASNDVHALVRCFAWLYEQGAIKI